jgi:hypothetical protein
MGVSLRLAIKLWGYLIHRPNLPIPAIQTIKREQEHNTLNQGLIINHPTPPPPEAINREKHTRPKNYLTQQKLSQ